MDGYEVKKVMDQIHISSEMQEEVIMNIQNCMEQGNKKTGTWNFRRMATAAAAPEGTLCYIRATGVFNLPAQEMTDEEMLEIIDFQHKMSYAVEHGPQAQAAKEEQAAREK